MHKTRIITFMKDQNNYGQRLQAYALCKFINDNFITDCKVLDFRDPSRHHESVKFREFEKQYMSIQDIKLSDINDKTADLFIFGGDQIYNARYVGNSVDMFTLPKINTTKKITYSASDKLSLAKNENTQITNRLKNFSDISLRERKSVEILRNKKTFKSIRFNIDPVFLLTPDQWRSISEKPDKIKEEIFNYNYIISKNTDKKELVDGVMTYYSFGNTTQSNIFSPTEFLWMIDNCEKLTSNSFHALCFSILFNTKIKLTLSDIRHSTIINLLKINSDLTYDYEDVMTRIIEEQKKSFDYLSKYLEKKK